MTKSKGIRRSSAKAKANRAAGSKRAAAARREVEAARRRGELPPAPPKERGKRGPAPYAGDLELLGSAAATPPKRAKKRPPATDEKPPAPEGGALFADVSLATTDSRRAILEEVIRAIGSRELQATEAAAIVAAVNGHARDKGGGDTRRRVRVSFKVANSREEAEQITAAHDEQRSAT